ncbi:MAG TPA: hypothetical protein VFI25_09175 [Planctomycetota bacterium]|jgi:hypothetical protein|nr:hypothetical protein [Planctomycetota bacterium]
MRSRGRASALVAILLAPLSVAALQLTVPPEVQQPGTQPLQVNLLPAPSQCDNCHGGYDPAVEPGRNWRGSMMAHATRDPLFWAAVAIAEQDFAGAGDLCIRCHSPRGWLEGRSTPTDGSALEPGDADGIECGICHKLVNPDDSEHLGTQSPPFVANDGGSPATGYYGSGMVVLWPGNDRLGPYADATAAPHAFLQSQFHRSPDLCGTCHDVSNPVVGDLAPNNGAQTPLAPGTFSGVPGGPVTAKAAFNNFPYRYGILERTYSEFRASALSTTLVSDYLTLPADLRAGALAAARQSALLAGTGGNYADGTPRTFSCQTCHMAPAVGAGCGVGSAPVRTDLPVHDLTGGNDWAPDAIAYLDAQGGLTVGGGLDSLQLAALAEGKIRARAQLELAATLTVAGNTVRIVNHTGHKLISGYPEGRRMWLDVRWRDAAGALVREDGAYGPIAADVGGTPTQVQTILDLDGANTKIYEARFGIGQAWATQLLNLGVPPALPLAFDRQTGAVEITLGQLASQAPGSAHESFHFVLNDVVLKDNRIPPFGMSRDESVARNVVPVPANQYGAPGPGGAYDYWDEVPLSPPPGAATASIELLYQPTSWEYVQFLALANDGSVTFLASEGASLLDAWLHTGMAAPHLMASADWSACPAACQTYGSGWPGSSGVPALTCSAPPVLGASIGVALSNSWGSATTAILVVGSAEATVPTGYGGSLLVTPGGLLALPVPPGGLVLPLFIPPDPALCGATFYGQAAEADPGASAGLSFTPGLRVRIGY